MLSTASRIVLIVVVLLSGAMQRVCGQLPAIGQWRTHLPWNQAYQLADGGNYIYCLSNVSFFSYDKSDGSIQKYDKVLGLSDVLVTSIAYSNQYNTLVVVYQDANIDLIVNNTIINFPDVMNNTNIIGTSTINSIYLMDSIAYLSCSFGIVAFDIKNQIINNTYYIGPNGDEINVNAVTSDGINLYAATDSGVYIASDTPGANLNDYAFWVPQNTGTGLLGQRTLGIINYKNNIVANVLDTASNSPITVSTLYKYNVANGQWTSFYYDSLWQIDGLDTVNGFLAASERNAAFDGQIPEFDSSFHLSAFITDPLIRDPMHSLYDAQGTLWVADIISGLLRFHNGAFSQVQVNGPGSIAVTNMSDANSNLWVATGGLDNLHVGDNNSLGIYNFSNGVWNTYNAFDTYGPLDSFSNIYAVLADPNSNNVYFGSTWYGLMIWNNGQATTYDQYNSILTGQTGNSARTGVTALALDDSSNLWLGTFLTAFPLVEKKPNGSWIPFSPPFSFTGGVVGIVIDNNGYLWCNQALGVQGIVVYNPTDSNPATAWQQLNNLAGSGNLPSTNVLSMALDQQGSIWVGTDMGVAVFYCPSTVFQSQGGCDAQQIIVSNNGFAGYLLSTDDVTAITIDGGNRKWMGTVNSGVWLFSPDGTQQIENFTVDNSPLLSNNIFSIAIDGATGEVFIGTDEGIISYRGDALAATDSFAPQKVCVFPNPVKQTYSGPIAIRCLAENSQVMITDARGDLVYETTSVGGEAVWNGMDYTGRKADTGVYLVFAINSDGSQSYVTKLVFVR